MKPGDIVVLRSDEKIRMTVTSVRTLITIEVSTCWFNEIGDLQVAVFPESCLRKVYP